MAFGLTNNYCLAVLLEFGQKLSSSMTALTNLGMKDTNFGIIPTRMDRSSVTLKAKCAD